MLSVPLHEPVRYLVGGQLMLTHVSHRKALVRPLHAPALNVLPSSHFKFLQALHVKPSVVVRSHAPPWY